MATRQNTLRAKTNDGAEAKRKAARRPRAKADGSPPIDRRELILAVATRRFAEYGFEATTVRQIADDVDILSGSLYHHFATKEEILEEIVRDAILQSRDDAQRIAELPLDAEQRFVALLMTELHRLTESQEVYAIAFNERKFFRRSEYFSYLSKAKKDAYEAWSAVLSDGVREGLFHPELDIYLTISTVIRMLNAGADWYKNEDGSQIDAIANYSLDKLLDFYLGYVLRAIRAPTRAGEAIPHPTIEL
ncbi:TetR/AcrR family transcriptional regulator [Novosphingobium sp. PS1R-30]|uniref:TetR/AcrR family transcriptional regulator n=1 Tax=Novosphingobium anseongense TaxID=3133436 RepID=A0ABU8RRX5_9SPHN|nr:MAG: TetR/AcrR family transcriptional regulator [Novosphingobium sp.]